MGLPSERCLSDIFCKRMITMLTFEEELMLGVEEVLLERARS
jgi:hypothetical protein